MRIGILVSNFPNKKPFYSKILSESRWGGIENVVYEMALRLNKLGYKIFVFTISFIKKFVFNYENVHVIRYGKQFTIGERNLSLKYITSASKFDLDLLHIHRGIPLNLFIGVYIKLIKRIPIVGTIHNVYKLNNTNLGATFLSRVLIILFKKLFYYFLLSQIDIVTTLSYMNYRESYFMQKLRKKPIIIPNGVKLVPKKKIKKRNKLFRNLEEIDEQTIIISFVGSLDYRKNPQLVVKFHKFLLKNNVPIETYICGSGPLLNRIKKISKNYDSINILGFISDKKLKDIYCASNIFVLPSVLEAQPIAIMEAMSYRTLIICSNLPVFNSFIIDDYNGFKIDFNNKDKLKEISSILKNREKVDELSDNSYDFIQKYSWEKIIKKYDKLYSEIYKY